MFRPFRRVDRRADREAPARECPRSKLNHRADVLDICPGELQRHHRVCGVAHLPETEGEPEAGKAVLHPGKGTGKMLRGSLTHGLQPSHAGAAIARGGAGVWGGGVLGGGCEQEMGAQGSAVTLFLPPSQH